MINGTIRLNTWVDIEQVFIESRLSSEFQWPTNVLCIKSYWDGINVLTSDNNLETINKWLIGLFDPRLKNEESLYILLEDNSTKIPIEIEKVEANTDLSTLTPVLRPTLNLGSYIFRKYKTPAMLTLDSAINIACFHSFKGGVGRTLNALAYTHALKKAGKKTLLIDGDFEAPGITFMINSWIKGIDISYSDFLALLHSDTSDNFGKTIEFVVNKLKNQEYDGIYLLPSFRTNNQQRYFDVKPEHIIQNIEEGYLIPEVLIKIAKELDVTDIVIDLRAGLSELSAGILFDPRVDKFLVTTLSKQSLEGTLMILSMVKDQMLEIESPLQPLTVILNQIPEHYLSKGEELDSIKKDFSETYFGDIDEAPEELTVKDLTFIDINFSSDLLALSNDFSDTFEKIVRLGLDTKFQVINISKLPSMNQDIRNARNLLKERTDEMIFAEKGIGENFLWTNPIRRLAETFITKLPNVVILGAKGAGKTFIFNQLVKSKSWKQFLFKGGFQTDIQVSIFPAMRPLAHSGNALDLFNNARREISTALNFTINHDIREFVEGFLSKDLNESEWRRIWLDAMALSIGISKTDKTSLGEHLIESLAQNKQKVLFVIDGLEDLFQDINSNNNQKIAVRSLLQRLPDWLEQLPDNPIGIIILVRQDYVDYSITQNGAQFIDRYSKFQLKWNVDEALRLFLYISSDLLGYSSDDKNDDFEKMSREEIIERLVPLWGLRLGSNKSKEAYSANWILTALSDWKGQIQARDIVRFLNRAAEESLKSQVTTTDRLLSVAAIKVSVEQCSDSKVKEVSNENKVLAELFKKLIDVPNKKTPFESESFGLNQRELNTLVEYGVLYKENLKNGDSSYHIAEIYRYGLGFNYKGRKMTKMLAFRRAIEN